MGPPEIQTPPTSGQRPRRIQLAYKEKAIRPFPRRTVSLRLLGMDLQRAANIAQILSLVPAVYGAYATWTLNRAQPVAHTPADSERLLPLINSTGLLVAFGAFVALVALSAVLAGLSWRQRNLGKRRTAATRQSTPYAVAIYTHVNALAKNRALADQVKNTFADAGWKVMYAMTDVPRHAKGVWIHGGTDVEQRIATWALRTLRIAAETDYQDDNPPSLQVIVGEYNLPDQDKALEETNKLIARGDSLETALREAQAERERLRGLLGIAEREVKRYRTEAALGKLRLMAGRYERMQQKIKVTVRFIEYSDHEMADWIASLLRTHTGWPVDIARDDGSRLRQESGSRLVFASGTPEVVKELVGIFNDALVIDEPADAMEIIDSGTADIVVTVFPKGKS